MHDSCQKIYFGVSADSATTHHHHYQHLESFQLPPPPSNHHFRLFGGQQRVNLNKHTFIIRSYDMLYFVINRCCHALIYIYLIYYIIYISYIFIYIHIFFFISFIYTGTLHSAIGRFSMSSTFHILHWLHICQIHGDK